MAQREFHGALQNDWNEPLVWIRDELAHGEWQDPWYPSKTPGAGLIRPGDTGGWRSESAGILTGTAGWAVWQVKAEDHQEYVRIEWSMPYYGGPTFEARVSRFNPTETRGSTFQNLTPPILGLETLYVSAAGNTTVLSDLVAGFFYVAGLPLTFLWQKYTPGESVLFRLRQIRAPQELQPVPQFAAPEGGPIGRLQPLRNSTPKMWGGEWTGEHVRVRVNLAADDLLNVETTEFRGGVAQQPFISNGVPITRMFAVANAAELARTGRTGGGRLEVEKQGILGQATPRTLIAKAAIDKPLVFKDKSTTVHNELAERRFGGDYLQLQPESILEMYEEVVDGKQVGRRAYYRRPAIGPRLGFAVGIAEMLTLRPIIN